MEIKKVLFKRSDIHLLRKAWHIFTGLFGLSVYFLSSLPAKNVGLGLVVFGFMSLCFDLYRIKFPKINEFVLRFMGPFMREGEKNSISGLPFYALGVGLSLVLFKESIAIISILFLVFADPISSAFGIKFGTQKIYGNKSLEGCVAGFITCFIIVLTYGMNTQLNADINLFAFAIIAAMAACMTELFSVTVDDNITIPVISGIAMTITNLIIPVF